MKVGQVVTAIVLSLLVFLGADATRWQNRAFMLERAAGPKIVQELAQTDRAHHNDQVADQFKLTDWLLLAVASFQVAVTSFQAWIYWHQTKIMKGLKDTADRQADIAAQQTSLAHQTYVATHRPRLRIRRVFLVFDSPITFNYLLANIGGSDAWILSLEVTVHVGPLAISSIYAHEHRIFPTPGMEFGAGQSRVFRSPTKDAPSYNRENVRDAAGWSMDDPDTWRLCFRGLVQYRDENQIERETAFDYVYDPLRRRMRPTGDEGFEYED